MDPIEKSQKKIDDYEKKALNKIRSTNQRKQKEAFNNLLIWIVLISVVILTLLFFIEL
tara:strand:+ start:8600 stop:8773 length:174 start_codon:yes stop_codon:yes gene_type:complete